MIFPSTFFHCCRACCTREFSRKFCLITISFYYQIGEDGWYWRKIESRIKKDVQVFLFSPHFLVINDNFAFVFNMILSDIDFFSLHLVFEIKSKPPVCTRARSQPDIDDHKTRMNMCRKLCSVWINSENRGTGTNRESKKMFRCFSSPRIFSWSMIIMLSFSTWSSPLSFFVCIRARNAM